MSGKVGIKENRRRRTMNTLIAFFSRAGENYFGGEYRRVQVGNTEIAADYIRELTGADVFQIKMKEPYSDDYNTCVEEAKKDLNENARPELVAVPESLESYDAVILGYPNYCRTCPMAVFTFLERFDFNGKAILPFCTNEGSGMGISEQDIAKSAPGANLKAGLSLNGSNVKNSKQAIESWLRENGVI
jgi:flavodoxin